MNNQDVTLLSTYLVELSLVDYSSLKVRAAAGNQHASMSTLLVWCLAALGPFKGPGPAHNPFLITSPPRPLPALQYPYSMIAAAATYVALKAVGAADAFPVALERHSGYNVASVQTCALHLAGLMRKAPVSMRGVDGWGGGVSGLSALLGVPGLCHAHEPQPTPLTCHAPPQNSSLVAVYKKYANEKLQRIATTYEAPADSELLGYAQ